MTIGKLDWNALDKNKQLVTEVVYSALDENALQKVLVAETDPKLADTENFCKEYEISMANSVNCVVVKAKRADKVWYGALLILATDRADVNKTVKKHLGASKLSFAPMDEAVKLTKMEYGGITPIGLPADWRILIDQNVVDNKNHLIIGSGTRGSKLAVTSEFILSLPGTETIKMSI